MNLALLSGVHHGFGTGPPQSLARFDSIGACHPSMKPGASSTTSHSHHPVTCINRLYNPLPVSQLTTGRKSNEGTRLLTYL